MPNSFIVGNTRITGEYDGPIQRARAFLDGVPKAIGGEFVDGRFDYYLGGGVNIDSKLQIEGWNVNNEVITEKIEVPIRESEE